MTAPPLVQMTSEQYAEAIRQAEARGSAQALRDYGNACCTRDWTFLCAQADRIESGEVAP